MNQQQGHMECLLCHQDHMKPLLKAQGEEVTAIRRSIDDARSPERSTPRRKQ